MESSRKMSLLAFPHHCDCSAGPALWSKKYGYVGRRVEGTSLTYMYFVCPKEEMYEISWQPFSCLAYSFVIRTFDLSLSLICFTMAVHGQYIQAFRFPALE